MLCQCGDIALGALLGRLMRSERVEGPPNTQNLSYIRDFQRAAQRDLGRVARDDVRAIALPSLKQAQLHERPHTFAHGGATDPEPLSELDLGGDAPSHRPASGGNLAPQLVYYSVDE